MNLIFADGYGVWAAGLAPLRDEAGRIVGAVEVDIPALDIAGLTSKMKQPQATMLETAASRLSRAEIDAITDGLTGLYNHRYLHDRLSEEIERARSEDTQLTLLFCDLDHFKDYNDLLGHSTGDRALRAVARIIEDSIRRVDLVARYGGEEFCVVLTETGAAEALGGRRAHPRRRRSERPSRTDAAASPSASARRRSPTTPTARRSSSTRPTGPCTGPSATDATGSWPSPSKTSPPPPSASSTLRGTAIWLSSPRSSRPGTPTRPNAARPWRAWPAGWPQGLGLRETETTVVVEAARLCDIGEISVPERILNKRGALSGRRVGADPRTPPDRTAPAATARRLERGGERHRLASRALRRHGVPGWVSPASRYRSPPASWPSPAPTTPWSSSAPTGRSSPNDRRSRSCAAAPARSSTRRSSRRSRRSSATRSRLALARRAAQPSAVASGASCAA